MSMFNAATKILMSKRNANYVMRKLATGTEIKYLRDGANGFKKVITKPNGTQITSHLAQDGSVSGIKFANNRGTINYTFGAQNYDKTIQVTPKIGGDFAYLGKKGSAKGLLYSNMSGTYQADNKYLDLFNQAINYIKGKSHEYLFNFCKLNNRV